MITRAELLLFCTLSPEARGQGQTAILGCIAAAPCLCSFGPPLLPGTSRALPAIVTTDTSRMPAALATEEPPVFSKINLNLMDPHGEYASVLFPRAEML